MSLVRPAIGLAMLSALALGAPELPAADPQPIRVLILTGQNNHDWRATTPVLQKTLTASRRFTVDVTEQPELCTAEQMARYDVLVSNWNSFGAKKDWPEATIQALLDYVRGGRGFVVIHAGGSMFYDQSQVHKEFHKMIGATWGKGTGHGPIHAFDVKPVDAEHPITRGIQPFEIRDELWHRMEAQPGKKVLATALSAKEKGGSGDNEPVAMTVDFGKGRCFNLVLGHDVAVMSNPGFQVLLLRGTEWAATGAVTLPATLGDQTDTLLKDIAGYRYGQARTALAAVEKAVFTASTDPAAAKALAAKLAAVLETEATPECKEFVCGQLSIIGTPAEVPALARRLSDEKLGFAARFALERIVGDESLAALRDGLKATSGKARVGLIDSLGARRDAKAVEALAALLGGNDAETSAAAMGALAMIGTPEAAQALASAEAATPAALRPQMSAALLRAAQSLLAAGRGQDALPLLEKLCAADRSRGVRMAALAGRAAAMGDRGGDLVLEALFGQDPVLRSAAGRILLLPGSASTSVLRAALKRLDNLAPEMQVQVLAQIGMQGDKTCAEEVARAIASKEPAVRTAAIDALGRLGGAEHVATLVALLEKSEGPDRKVPCDALVRLRGDGVDAAIAAAMTKSPAAGQCDLIRALAARGAKQAVPALLTAAQSSEAPVAREAIRAMSQVAGCDAVPQLVALLDKAADTTPIEAALSAIARRENNAEPLVAAMAGASKVRKLALLAVLGSIGGDKPLVAVRDALKADDAEIRQAAVRSLAAWPDAAALVDLVAVATKGDDAKAKILALRGVARLVPMAKEVPAEKLGDMAVRALATAERPEEIRMLLASLGAAPSLAGMKAAAGYLDRADLSGEAALAVVQIAETIQAQHEAETRAAIEQVKAAVKDPAILGRIAAMARGPNLARGATATNPDGLATDGEGGGPMAAIDGKLDTYWDEVDHQPLYRIRVILPRPAAVAALRITGFQHHNYAPRDFEVFCDGKVVQTVRDAQYKDNVLVVGLPTTTCKTVELKITRAHGPSPAIRELEILGK